MFTPKYTITNNLLKYIGRIEACKEVITNAVLIPAWEAKFRDDARARTIHFGTHIEGNDLTFEQAQMVIRIDGGTSAQDVADKAGVVARERDIQEVINYRAVLEWIDQWKDYAGKQQVQYSEHLLLKLHELTTARILPPDQVGQYRKTQVVIRSVENGEVVFRPPVYLEVPGQLHEFFAWLVAPASRELHPVIRAGIALYELVRIHPFIEGNGRTARAFTLLVLYAEGYDIKKLFSLEEYFDHDVEGYYRALQSVQKTSDATYWLEYFCFGLAVELDRTKQKVVKLSQDAKLKEHMGGAQIALSERQIMILEFLREKNNATTTEINKILPMISQDTILRDLKDMLKKGVLKKEGVTKGVVYYLRDQ